VGRGDADVVRELFDAVARGDDERVLALYADDVEWDGARSRWAEVMSGDPCWRGHDELRSFFRAYYEMWERLEHELSDVQEVGSTVVAVVTVRGRGRASGVEVEWTENTGVFTVRDGRIVKVVWFASREEALAEARASGP
jgi:ketosteroid isomerase-like protein